MFGGIYKTNLREIDYKYAMYTDRDLDCVSAYANSFWNKVHSRFEYIIRIFKEAGKRITLNLPSGFHGHSVRMPGLVAIESLLLFSFEMCKRIRLEKSIAFQGLLYIYIHSCLH